MKNRDEVMIITNPESGFFKGQGTLVFILVLCYKVSQDHSVRKQQMNNVVIHFTHYDLKWVTNYICGFKWLVLVSSIVVDGLKRSRNGDNQVFTGIVSRSVDYTDINHTILFNFLWYYCQQSDLTVLLILILIYIL